MKQWLVLFEKELLEMARNYKWVWVPLTFILIGINQPISSYYMPQIIDMLGGLPDGAVIKLPEPAAGEVLVKGLSQYTTLGVLIIILTSMGMIAGERKSGVAALILVKPVSYSSFVTSKWAGAFFLMAVSFLAGYFATWYYTGVLYDWIGLDLFFKSLFLYVLWFTFVLTITIFFSASFFSAGTAGFLSVATTLLISLISSSLSHWLKWSPSRLTDYANQLLVSGDFSKALLPAVLLTVSGIVVLLAVSILVFRKKELAA